MKYSLPVFICLLVLGACSTAPAPQATEPRTSEDSVTTAPVKQDTVLNLASMLAKREVPVLCYHHIRNFSSRQSESMKSYSVTPAAFAEQMKALYDSGYQTILPGQSQL